MNSFPFPLRGTSIRRIRRGDLAVIMPPNPVPAVVPSGKLETGPGENGRQQLGSQHLNSARIVRDIAEVTKCATGRDMHGVMHERGEDRETEPERHRPRKGGTPTATPSNAQSGGHTSSNKPCLPNATAVHNKQHGTTPSGAAATSAPFANATAPHRHPLPGAAIRMPSPPPPPSRSSRLAA